MSHSQVAHIDHQFYLPADEFFLKQVPDALTYDDVSLATHYSQVAPKDTDPTTQLTETITLSTPFISADMDTVTEHRMAIAMALSGGLGIIHSNLSPEEQIRQVARVKHYVQGIITDPKFFTPGQTIGEVIQKIEEKGYTFGNFPVLEEGKLVGFLPSSVIKDRHRSKQVYEVMMQRDELKTLSESELGDEPIQRASRFFGENVGHNKLLVVDEENTLKGLITERDIDEILKESQTSVKPTRDDKHRLRVGVTLHMFRDSNGNLDRNKIIKYVEELVEKGVDIVAISSAHGYTESMGDMVSSVRDFFPELQIIAGNVTSAQGVEFLKDAGANTIKIGQGPGSICTTRGVAGVGIPQMTALYVCSRAVQILGGVRIIADGGISKSGDTVKALTLADAIMAGGIFAGAEEAPGDTIEFEGKVYKQYRGMGSMAAMKDGSAARYGHSAKDKNRKITAEGIEGAKLSTGPVADIVRNLLGGIQAGMGYHGAQTLADLREKARYVRMTGAGQVESGTRVPELKSTERRSK